MSGLKRYYLSLWVGPLLGTLVGLSQLVYPLYTSHRRAVLAWGEYQLHTAKAVVAVNTRQEPIKACLVWRSFDKRIVVCVDNQTNTRNLATARVLKCRDNFQRFVSVESASEVLSRPREPAVVELKFRPPEECHRLWVEIELELQQEEAAEETKLMLEGLVSVY